MVRGQSRRIVSSSPPPPLAPIPPTGRLVTSGYDDHRALCADRAFQGTRNATLVSPDARFANRFRDKHARRRRRPPPLYDRRGKFAGENGRRYFIPVYRCSAPPLSLSLSFSLFVLRPPVSCSGVSSATGLEHRGCVLIEMFIRGKEGGVDFFFTEDGNF